MAEQYRDSGRGFGTLPAVVEGARAGDVRLMTELGARFESGGDFGGYRHMTGRVRWANVEEAEYWYERAATAGHAPAMRNLGLLAVRGARGNKGKGESWLEQASNAGDQTALEYDRAMRGDSTAVAALGWRYYTGANEFPRVFDETVRWSAQAMDNGSEDGYYQIGLSYELGLGPFGGRGGRDMARPFYQHAADAGHERALAALSRLGR